MAYSDDLTVETLEGRMRSRVYAVLHDIEFVLNPTGGKLARCRTCGWASPSGMQEYAAHERATRHLFDEARRSRLTFDTGHVVPLDAITAVDKDHVVSLLHGDVMVPAEPSPEPLTILATTDPYELEQEYLDRLYAAASRAVAAALRRDNATADATTDAAVSQLRAERLQSLQRLLHRDDEAIVFGRLDWADERLYVGRHPVFDEQRHALVSSWRAPRAATFYRASKEAPDGLLRRRRIVERGRTVTNLVDEVLVDRLPADLADDVVKSDPGDLLARALETSRDGRMSDIVVTIQPDQFTLIGRPTSESLLIQGGPGTGKTAVGLHRLSYLLYEEEGAGRLPLRHDDVAVVGPTTTFLDFISQVLPGLGDVDVPQMTFTGLLGQSRSAPRTPEPRAEVIGRTVMATVINNLVWSATQRPDQDHVAAQVELSRDVLGSLWDRACEGAATYEGGRTQFRSLVLRHLLDAPRPPTRDDAGSAASRISDRYWPSLHAEDIITYLLSDRSLVETVAAGLFSPAEMELIAPDSTLTLGDLTLVDEARAVIHGRPERTYGHIMVDEVQDLTPMDLRALRRRVPSGSFTLMGDMAQSTRAGAVTSWTDVAVALDVRGASSFSELLTAYRVPAETLHWVNQLFPALQVGTAAPQPHRSGFEPPSVRRSSTPDDAVLDVALEVARWLRGDGYIGVVVPDDHDLGTLRETVASLSDDFEERVEFHHASSVSGLEFDHLVVLEPLAIVGDDGARGLRRLYVALTRTTRTLAVMHTRGLPALLDGHHASAEGRVVGAETPQQ